MDFKQVREKYPQFIYKSFTMVHQGEGLTVKFAFEISPDTQFYPEVVFPNISKQRLEAIGEAQLNNLIFNLGMVEMLSYWKAACPPEIVIKAGYLDQEQIKFWQELLIKGLGEFFYSNQIDFTQEGFVKFVVNSGSVRVEAGRDDHLKERDLILVGGGKDSAVTVRELSKRESNCLLLNPIGASTQIVKISGFENPIIIKRTIDPKLLELNKQGYLNGHTPFSACLAFLSTLVGVLYDYKNLIVSNEESANEGNINWLGQEINHQYSKSFEFEQKFREYNQKYLSNTNYVSFLRPLNELEISKLFAEMPEYQLLFRSCNVGSKQGIWCGACPKCVSTYLLLFPFLGERTNQIFGKDLYQDETIIPIIAGLMRLNEQIKPFECVASVDEIKYAIFLSAEKFNQESLPIVLKKLKNYGIDKPELMTFWNKENNLSEEYSRLLKSKI